MAKTAPTEREIAYQVLRRILWEHRLLQEAMTDASRSERFTELFAAKRKSVEQKVKGTLERKVPVEYVLKELSSVPLKKMNDQVRTVLLLGTFELLFTDVERYAAVNEYVTLLKNVGGRVFSGFVNGVLRSVERKGNEILAAAPKHVRLSLSEKLYGDLVSWYGEEAAEQMGAYVLSPEAKRMTIRRNESKCSEDAFLTRMLQEGVRLSPTGYGASTYTVVSPIDVSRSKAFSEGLYYVQDPSSVLSGNAVSDLFSDPERPVAVLDACASPGGKTIHLADLAEYAAKKNAVKSSAAFLACDVSASKVKRINENAERSGFDSIHTEVRDGTVFDSALADRFDLVIVDAPCSGLGVIAGKPDLRERYETMDLASLFRLQETLLGVNARYVKPGGTLLYSTCTVDPEENEKRVAAFLSAHPEFTLVSERLFLPGRDATDGFYYARLLRSCGENAADGRYDPGSDSAT